MAGKPIDWTAYAGLMAPVLGLELDEAARGRVAGALAMAAAAAAVVTEFALDEAADEPAAVFRPGRL